MTRWSEKFWFALVLHAPVYLSVAADIAGTPTIIEGEILKVEGKRSRLAGIDVTSPKQTCFIRIREWRWGLISTTAPMALVAGVNICCRAGDPKPDATRCWAGSYELSKGMLHASGTLVLPRDQERFAPIELQAFEARRDLWQGEFVLP